MTSRRQAELAGAFGVGWLPSGTDFRTVHPLRSGPGTTVPTLLQVMNGQGTNSPPIEPTTNPGAEYHDSGAGFVLLQRLMEQVSGTWFSRFMQSQPIFFRPPRPR